MRVPGHQRKSHTWRWTAALAGLAVLALALVMALVVTPAGRVEAASYTVDTTSDANLTACTTAAADCSLRGAINNANASSGVPDTINFNIPGAGPHTITQGSALPDITDDRLSINAGAEVIIIKPAAGAGWGQLLRIDADNVSITGLILDGDDENLNGIVVDVNNDEATITNVEIMDLGTGVSINFAGNNDANVVDDVFIHDNVGTGISLGSGSDDNIIRNSTFTGNGGNGIDFNGGQDNAVRDSTITNNGDAAWDNGLELSNEDDFLVQGNTFSGNFYAQILIGGMLAGQNIRIIQNTITSSSDGIVVGGPVHATAQIDIGLSVENRNVFRGTIAAPAEQHLRNLSAANINAIYNDWDAYSPAAIEGAICHASEAGCGSGVVDYDPFIATPSPWPGGLASPGGIVALPSAVPAIPGISNQGMPAIIGSGQPAIVAVFCDDGMFALPFDAGLCANPVTFQLTRVYPEGGAPLATFDATATDSLVVTDDTPADMDAATGVVAVHVNAGWGANEVLRVTATDSYGNARVTTIVVVDTIMAWGPTGAVATVGQEGFAFVSYQCSDMGRAPIINPIAQFAESQLGDADNSQGLDDMYDAFYGPFNGLGNGWGSNTLFGDADFFDLWCGGDTVGRLFDDFVHFQTDKGIFSIDPAVAMQQDEVNLGVALGYFYPPSLDADCGEGQHVYAFDIDALSPWGQFLLGWPPGGSFNGGCDVDGWRSSVVTTQILPSGEVGVATIAGQQGGGVGPLRTVNVLFVGPAASLFIEIPDWVRPFGADFTALVVDQGGRPVGGEDVRCSVSPADGPFAILANLATTGPDGIATFRLIPTGASFPLGQELTITCSLVRDPLVSATETIVYIGFCGDVNLDWENDAVDALFVLQYVVGLRPGDNVCVPGSGVVCLPNSDVDCDGKVDAVDALFILQYVVCLRPQLCACPPP